ncbi:hypothetical protein [Baekduia soli]|uniref:hypothetical protein n=1 Tax=Baekduia soli TaxID=496014 RepID=UPI001652968F|nr:hypothetical protein [Baekduia soli]
MPPRSAIAGVTEEVAPGRLGPCDGAGLPSVVRPVTPVELDGNAADRLHIGELTSVRL